jgi:hypothetical protein
LNCIQTFAEVVLSGVGLLVVRLYPNRSFSAIAEINGSPDATHRARKALEGFSHEVRRLTSLSGEKIVRELGHGK